MNLVFSVNNLLLTKRNNAKLEGILNELNMN